MKGSLARAAVVAAALMGLGTPAQAAEVHVPHGGLALDGNLVLADGKALGDGVVLITHGTLAHNGMEIVQSLQDLLRERGLSSLAINLSLGLNDRHGMYDCSVPHRHRNSDAIAEIAAWVDWLKAQGTKSIVLLGHSRGANQTAWYAAERTDPAVTAMVLVAPLLPVPADMQKSYQKAFGKDLEPVLARARDQVARGEGQTLMQPVDILYCADTAATAEALLSYHVLEPRMDTPALMQRASVPTLVIAGSADEQVPGVDRAFESLAREGKVRLTVIDGADHFFRDLYAEDTADAIAEFLQAR